MRETRVYGDEWGPALLCDAAYLESLARGTTMELVAGTVEEAARAGRCCWLASPDTSWFGGTVEVLVEEPVVHEVPASAAATGLRLHAPTGELRLLSAAALLNRPRSSPPLELKVPAGNYRVELFAYRTPSPRAERVAARGERRGRTNVANVVGCLLVLATAVLLVSAVTLAWGGELGSALWPLGLAAGLWASWLLVSRLTAQPARPPDRAPAAAALPTYRIVLARQDAEVAAPGGGLTA